jgi:hypothetical protein
VSSDGFGWKAVAGSWRNVPCNEDAGGCERIVALLGSFFDFHFCAGDAYAGRTFLKPIQML